MIPSLQEATNDLTVIRNELEHMRGIRNSAQILSRKTDVDCQWYTKVFYKTNQDIINGEQVEQAILKLYPTLQ